jgi:hypothetical protein
LPVFFLPAVGNIELIAEVARCRYGEVTLGTMSIKIPEASCTEMHEDAKLVWKHIASIVRRSSTEAYPVLEQLKEVVRIINEEDEAVRASKQLEEDLGNDGGSKGNSNGLDKVAGEPVHLDEVPMVVGVTPTASDLSLQYPARHVADRPLGRDDFSVGEVVMYNSRQGGAKLKDQLCTIVKLLPGQVEISLNGLAFIGLKTKKVAYTTVFKHKQREEHQLDQETLPARRDEEGATIMDVSGDSNDPSAKDDKDMLLASLYGDLDDLG